MGSEGLHTAEMWCDFNDALCAKVAPSLSGKDCESRRNLSNIVVCGVPIGRNLHIKFEGRCEVEDYVQMPPPICKRERESAALMVD